MLRSLGDSYRARVVVRSIPIAGMSMMRYADEPEGEPLEGEYRVSKLEDGVLVVRSISGSGALAVRHGPAGLEWEEIGNGGTPPQQRDLVALVHVFDQERLAWAAREADWTRIPTGAGTFLLEARLDAGLVEDPPKDSNNSGWGHVAALYVDVMLEIDEQDRPIGADLDVVLGIGMAYDDTGLGFNGGISNIEERSEYTPIRLQTIQLQFNQDQVSEVDRTLAQIVRGRSQPVEAIEDVLPQKGTAPEGARLEGDPAEVARTALAHFLSPTEPRRWIAESQVQLPPRIRRGIEALAENGMFSHISVFDPRRLVSGTLDLVQLGQGLVALRGIHGHEDFLAAPGDPPLLSSGRNGQGLQPVATILLKDLSGLFESSIDELLPEDGEYELRSGGPPSGARVAFQLADAPFDANPLDPWNERAGLIDGGVQLVIDLDASGSATRVELVVRRECPIARHSVRTNGVTVLESEPEEGEITELRQSIALVPALGEPPTRLTSFAELARLLRIRDSADPW